MRTYLMNPALGWGLRLTLTFALFYAVASLIHRVIKRVSGEAVSLPLDQVAMLDLAAAYVVGGLASGLILNRSSSLARHRTGLVAAGALASIPFLLDVRLAMKGHSGWEAGEVLWLAVLAVGIGIATGSRRAREDPRPVEP